MAEAQMITALLERFSGYTYTSLMNEDPELMRILQIEALGTRKEVSGG